VEWNGKRFRGFVGAEVGMIIGQLLDVVFNETIDVPFEHWAVDIETKLLSDVFVDLFRVRRAAHAFDPKEFKVVLLKVMEAMARDCVVDTSELWHEASRRGRRHYR
jgi:hypothetical protein